MVSLSSHEASHHFESLLQQVAEGMSPIAIEAPGDQVVYLISAQDYQLFQVLRQQQDDQEDVAEAETRMTDPHASRIGIDQFFAELNDAHDLS